MPWPAVVGGILATLVLSQVVLDSPIGRAKTTLFDQKWPNKVLPEQSSVMLRLWNVISHDEYYEKMRVLGYSEDKANELLQSMRTYLSSAEVVEYGRRTAKTDPEIIEDLVDHGYDRADAEHFLHISYFRPGASDLIHWAEKEVFEPEQIEHYGLDDEFGELDLEAFRVAGISEEQARNFWRAHWEHPGWATTQTLLHRQLIEPDEVRRWFRTVEIPPFWRQLMMDASYHPLTRVDVRRMHKLGNLDDDELYKAYRDVGYNDYNANKMVEWTIDYNTTTEDDPDRDLTRAQLERGYRLGVLTPSQLDEALEAMGYDRDKRAYITELLDEGQRIDEGQEWLGLIRAQTVSGLMSVEDAKNKLAELGFASGSVDHYGELFTAYKEQPHKIPSKSDVKAFVTATEISPDQAYDFMRDLGYADNDIEIYLRVWAGGEEQYRAWVEKMMAIWDEYEARKRLPGSAELIDRMVTGGYTPTQAS